MVVPNPVMVPPVHNMLVVILSVPPPEMVPVDVPVLRTIPGGHGNQKQTCNGVGARSGAGAAQFSAGGDFRVVKEPMAEDRSDSSVQSYDRAATPPCCGLAIHGGGSEPLLRRSRRRPEMLARILRLVGGKGPATCILSLAVCRGFMSTLSPGHPSLVGRVSCRHAIRNTGFCQLSIRRNYLTIRASPRQQ